MRLDSLRYPKPLPEPVAKTLRLMWAKIQHPDGCWECTGSILANGYPSSICVDGSRKEGNDYRPQRLMFHWFKYAIPDGFTVDHLCKNKRCVNPDHMEAVTHEENASRGNKKRYCLRGHPQIPENRYPYKSCGRIRERCKPCIPIQVAALKARKAAETK